MKKRNKNLDPTQTYFNLKGNYCLKCWAEFVTLTQQERENLKDRARVMKRIKAQTQLYT